MGEHADQPEPEDDVAELSGESTAADGDAAEPSNRDLTQHLLLAGLGALSLTREKAESLVDDLVKRGSTDKQDEASDSLTAPRFGGERLVDRASSAMTGLFRELGLVTDPTIDELELRIAQLEHRLRILERKAAEPGKPTPPPRP